MKILLSVYVFMLSCMRVLDENDLETSTQLHYCCAAVQAGVATTSTFDVLLRMAALALGDTTERFEDVASKILIGEHYLIKTDYLHVTCYCLQSSTFRRSEITRSDSTHIYHDLLKDQGRFQGPEI